MRTCAKPQRVAGGEDERKAPKRAARPAKKPQPVRASAMKRRTASQERPSRPASVPARVPVAPKPAHTAKPTTKEERAPVDSAKAWRSQRSREEASILF